MTSPDLKLKERVKKGQTTAKDALGQLIKSARANGQDPRKIKTYGWLKRRREEEKK